MLEEKMNKKIDKFDNFMNGFTAAAQLAQRASKQGCFIECVCLTASIIDGLLRIGLILNHQLKAKTKDILNELLYQSDEDKIISERKIYEMALKENIISENLFDQLEKLYKKRNKIVHRYIISAITTKEVLNIAMEYDNIQHLVSDAVKILENQQIEKGIGMTVAGKNILKEEVEKLFNDMSSKKHGDKFLDDKLKNSF